MINNKTTEQILTSEDSATNSTKGKDKAGLLAGIPLILAAILLFLKSDFTGRMVLEDKFTPFIVVLVVIGIVICLLTCKQYEESVVEKPEDSQGPLDSPPSDMV